MSNYLRFNGYRVKHAGQGEGDQLVGNGHLCVKDRNSDNDPVVVIYFTPNVGYTYTII